MSTKAVVGSLIAAAIAAFLAGAILTPSFSASTIAKLGVIRIDANGACSQQADFKPVNFPVLEPSHAGTVPNSIVWFGQDKDGNKTSLLVQFPDKAPDSSVGTPFTSGIFSTPKTTFKDGEDSGPPHKAYDKDFPFKSVTVGNVPCMNPNGTGVHVDR